MTLIRHIFAHAARRRAAWGVTAAAAFAWGASAAAQAPVGKFSVTTRAGGISFEKAASLDRSFLLGVDADYGLMKFLSIGTSINVTRPNTHAQDFTRTITYGQAAAGGDTTYFYQVGQAVSLVEASATASLRSTFGRVTPYVSGGAGIYGAFLDAQKNNGTRRFSGLSTQLAGGLAFALTDRAGIEVDVRDVMLHAYRQNRLDPSRGRNPNTIFPEEAVIPPARKDMVHSFGYTLGFRYVPVFLNPTTGDPDDRILNPNGQR